MGRRRYQERHQNARPRPARRSSLGKATTALLVVAVFSVAALATFLLVGRGTGPPAEPKTAAIVDQLSLTQANPSFVERSMALLQQAGYAVDYYPGQQVTVDFYRNLPTYDYDLIILRVHSGVGTKEGEVTDQVSLFTAEPFSRTSYASDRRAGGLAKAFYYEESARYFAITSKFIEDMMQGRFDKTLIVMMGCDGLRSRRTAQAFLDRGASAFVSWSMPVSAAHTDTATERLLELLLVEGLSTEDAVRQSAAEVGPDPSYGAELRVLTDGR